MKSRLCLCGLALAFLSAPVFADVSVTDAWVRGTVPGQQGTGAFMRLTSGTDIALVRVSSPAAKVAEIHEMALTNGVMRMRAVDRVPLPAGAQVEFKPGGYHVMLMDLVHPLKEGDSVPVTLTFVDKDGRTTTQVVAAPVRALTASGTTSKQ